MQIGGLFKCVNMANRRMFSNRIARSAKFLQMPLEAQALYFHLILNADDDGVVEVYPITRTLGTASDIIKILLTKEFIVQLNEDQVMLINNWLEHNSIRADRKVDSIYKHLIPENIALLKAKPRTDVEDNSKRLGGQSTDGLSKVRLGKVKLSKVKTDKVSYGEFNNVKLTPNEYTKLIDLMGEDNVKGLIFELDTYIASKGKRYKSHYATLQSWARRKALEIKSKKKEIIGLN